MKRNYVIYVLIPSLMALIFQSCTKEMEILPGNEISHVPYSYFKNEIKYELVLTDGSGQNSVFLAIYADNQNRLEKFTDSYELNLIIVTDERSENVFKSEKLTSNNDKKSLANLNLEQEPKIYIEVVYENLKEEIKHYFIDVKLKSNKKSFVCGYPIGFVTSNDFVGTVHLGWGSEYFIRFRYKLHWYSFWKDWEVGGVNAWWIWPSSSYWGSLALTSYKLQLILYPDLYQTTTNYRIAYQSDDMRGHSCSLGGYDGCNCYVGEPPSGTTAFIYTYQDNNSYFMYTPVDGNQCPLEGSSFDGANCQYLLINPYDVSDAFIYNNRWYMRPDLIPGY